MIPISLRLRNFMCYREGLPPLDLGDIHVACISGPNGAGKSSLLDAITWALWGRARARSDDALIATGAQEMEVEFEFLLEGNHYRVFRRRDRAAGKGAGKTQLDLQVYGEQGWRSLAGETVRQTEAQIVALLRMDYDTFINSAFLLQGRADEFAVKPPAERKRILADILGLSYYDVLEQRAREHLRAEERGVQALALLLQEQERQLAGRPAQEEALARAKEEAERAAAVAAQAQQELGRLQAGLSELEATARQVEELHRRLAQMEREIGRLDGQRAQAEERLQQTQALLERQEEIAAGYERLRAVRERSEALAQAAGRLLTLGERRRSLEQAIERARGAQVTEREVLRRALAEAAARLRERPALEERRRLLHERLEQLRQKEARLEAVREEIPALAAAAQSHRAEMQRLRQEMAALDEKLALLAEGRGDCPLCHSPLDRTSYQHICDAYRQEGEEKSELHRAHEAEAQKLEERLAALRTEQEKLGQEVKRARLLEGQCAALERELHELERLADEQEGARARLQEAERILAAEEYAPQERAALAALEAEIAALGYDRDEHAAVQQELGRLRAVEEEYRALQSARERLAAEEQRRQEAQEALEQRRQEAAAEQARLEELAAGLEELPERRARHRAAEADLQAAQEALGQARLALGAAQRELQRLQEVELDYQEKRRRHAEAVERRGIYDELATALGKRGVQAMLIETAVPEIEREANKLLGQMTEGEMSAQLAMQRATKQGSIVETLDINIADAQGVRALETYSGGENFRINFALRVALSRLLAHRAGASLQTLVIDEGFGSQDAQGRERLIEAIRSIQDQFERILVITHIQELKEAFPVRIEVERSPEGSRWTVL